MASSIYELEKEFKGDFELRHRYWFSEWDNKGYHFNSLLKNGNILLTIPTANRKFTIDEMIGMWKVRSVR